MQAAPPPPEVVPVAETSLSARYLAAQLLGDRREALRLLVEEGLGEGLDVTHLHLQVIQPAQIEIGRLWQENRITVAQEHLATAISELALAHLYRHMSRASSKGKFLLVACIEGERHQLGARIGADFLEMNGYEVLFLGSDVPVESVAALVKERRPDAVMLAMTIGTNLQALVATIARVREVTAPHRLPVLVVGQGLDAYAGKAGLIDAEVVTGAVGDVLAAINRALGVL